MELPRGFGTAPSLAILDLTYNNLSDDSFPGNFSYLGGYLSYLSVMCFTYMASGTLRALYMGDNDLNSFPPSVEKFELLQVVNYHIIVTGYISCDQCYSWCLETTTSPTYLQKCLNAQI